MAWSPVTKALEVDVGLVRRYNPVGLIVGSQFDEIVNASGDDVVVGRGLARKKSGERSSELKAASSHWMSSGRSAMWSTPVHVRGSEAKLSAAGWHRSSSRSRRPK